MTSVIVSGALTPREQERHAHLERSLASLRGRNLASRGDCAKMMMHVLVERADDGLRYALLSPSETFIIICEK